MSRFSLIQRVFGLLCLMLLSMTAAHAQTFRATEGNKYYGESTNGDREDNCTWEKQIKRKVDVSRDQGANRLTYTMTVDYERQARYRGNNQKSRLECDPGFESGTYVIRFYIDQENKTSTEYSGTVIEGSRGLHGYKRSDRISGTVQVFDGGRGLEFNNEEFTSGSAKVLSVGNFKNNVGAEQAFFLPQRSPDVVVSCKVISAQGTTVTNSSNSNTQYSNGSNARNDSNSSSNSSCLAYGWQNLRKSVSVWTNEKRCDGYACDIGTNTYKWSKGEVNRMTGQMTDGCYVYECDRTSNVPKF